MSDLLTERLVLHPLTVSESEQVLAGERGDGTRWAPDYPTQGDVFAAKRFLGTCANAGDPQPFGNYEIRLRTDGRAIGGIGFHGVPDENGSVSIGYGLSPSVRGAGYASEALRGLLRFARERGVTCVKGDTDQDNLASQHVMLAAGMRQTDEDERLKYYETTWTEEGTAPGTEPRG